MIEQLPERNRAGVRKQDLINLEFKIVTALQFDLQWVSPLVPLDRYIFLMGY
jgi:hypothetical protein